LVLDNVTAQTSGFYKCEITAEPLFFTVEKEAEMRVVSLAGKSS
jgi:hypothetical protein